MTLIECEDISSDDLIDSMTVGRSVLAAYPGFLLLGIPSYRKGTMVFLQRNQIRFPSDFLPTVMKKLFSIAKKFKEDSIPDTFEVTLLEEEYSVIKAKKNPQKEGEILIQSVQFEKTVNSFTFNLFYMVHFLKAFKFLFLKPFCFKIENEIQLEELTKKLLGNEIEIPETITVTDFTCLIAPFNITKTEHQNMYLAQIYLRYQKEMTIYKILCQKVNLFLDMFNNLE